MRKRKRPYLNALPEYTNYKVGGCILKIRGKTFVIPDCLDCLLPICKFDDPGWIVREAGEERDKAIVKLKAMGWSYPAIAVELDTSTRTILRALKAQRELQEMTA